MSVEESDLKLVERVQRGERAAFDLLVLRYQHKVLKLIMRYVHDATEAEDIAQEAFVKAYRALQSFRGDSAFYTWLYRIAITSKIPNNTTCTHGSPNLKHPKHCFSPMRFATP
jgi:RNA polymerase sigma-70 factor, ECF subfamily